MTCWDEIRDWRRATRRSLLARRTALSQAERQRLGDAVIDRVAAEFPELKVARIGFYWPFKGEIDLLGFVQKLLGLGAEAALPVVVEKQQPLEFWAWHPGIKLGQGIWNIPIPAERNPVRPTALLVPLLGFDAAGYRLGYGGGYYDRSLAGLKPRPLTIGVGYESGRLESIQPQPFDIPLDAIVTEAGCTRHRYRGAAPETSAIAEAPVDATDPLPVAASPPCFMHELGPAYLGYMDREETIALLNGLLAASGLMLDLLNQPGRADAEEVGRRNAAMDWVRHRTMLGRHIGRLGGAKAPDGWAIRETLAMMATSSRREDLLDCGHSWILGTLHDGLNRIGDGALHRDLKAMLDAQKRARPESDVEREHHDGAGT